MRLIPVKLFIILGIINKVFEEVNITSDNIDLAKFKDIFKIFEDELTDSLEKIQYMPYMFFKLKCEDKKVEKNCIEILMKGNKNIKEFIGECFALPDVKLYYIIDIEFWYSWCDYVNWDNNNIENDYRPRINSMHIANANGILHQGLVYLKDYIIVTEKMYELFKYWYICLGPDLPRYKIEKIVEKKLALNNSVSSKQQLMTTPAKKEKIYEIEIYPVFVKLYNMEELIHKAEITSTNELKDYLHSLSVQIMESGQVLEKFSKHMHFKDMLKHLDNSGQKVRLWIYNDNKFNIPSVDKTLDEEGLSDFIIAVLEHSKNSKWVSETLDKISFKKKRTLYSSRSMVGLTNLGNSNIF
jgi:hypothetical protein